MVEQIRHGELRSFSALSLQAQAPGHARSPSAQGPNPGDFMHPKMLSRVRERVRVANLQPVVRRTKGVPLLEAGSEPYPGHRIREYLGRGAFGEVWLTEVAGGKPVALKFMPCDGRGSTQELRTLQKVRQIQHPNLIRIDRVWCYARHLVVSMELAEGSLDDLLSVYKTEFDTPMVPEQVCWYLNQVATAIDFLNRKEHKIDGQLVAVRHCDVKPSNMLVFGRTVKLTDFSLSLLTSIASQPNDRAGTPSYAGPELFQGRVNDRTDQYALAVSYCELRGGRMPFPDTPATFQVGYVRPHPDLSMVPEAERAILARALAPNPVDRWPSCTELMAKLSAAIQK
jgi:serine/threonine-protein kinase